MEKSEIEKAKVSAPFNKEFAEKLFKLMVHCDRVPKDKKNEHQNYSYASDAVLKEKFREGLIANRLVCVFNQTREEQNGDLTKVYMTFEIMDIDNDAGRSFNCMGYGKDKQDKALYKAITGAIKYFIFGFTFMPTGDDPEKDEPGLQWEKEKAHLVKTIETDRINNAGWWEKFLLANAAARSAEDMETLDKIQNKAKVVFKNGFLTAINGTILDRRTLLTANPGAK